MIDTQRSTQKVSSNYVIPAEIIRALKRVKSAMPDDPFVCAAADTLIPILRDYAHNYRNALIDSDSLYFEMQRASDRLERKRGFSDALKILTQEVFSGQNSKYSKLQKILEEELVKPFFDEAEHLFILKSEL